MCDHPNREAAMVVIGTPEHQGRDAVWCDPCLAPLVKALNAGGIRTTASCCGHGQAPSTVQLEDGRWLTLTDKHLADLDPAGWADLAPQAVAAAEQQLLADLRWYQVGLHPDVVASLAKRVLAVARRSMGGRL